MYLSWKKGGILLGLTFFLAVVLVKPIGVSTQFVIADGLLASLVSPSLVKKDESAKAGYSSPNAYLNKSGGKYARAIAKPLNYGFIFAFSIFLGGLLGRLFTKNEEGGPMVRQIPDVHSQRFNGNVMLRYGLSFIGGIIVLWGARLAGGCTSGHMMSEIMQTSVSGYLFAGVTFLVAVPTAILLYRK